MKAAKRKTWTKRRTQAEILRDTLLSECANYHPANCECAKQDNFKAVRKCEDCGSVIPDGVTAMMGDGHVQCVPCYKVSQTLTKFNR